MTGGYLPMATLHPRRNRFSIPSSVIILNSKLFSTATVSPAINWELPPRWPVLIFCKAGNPSGARRRLEKNLRQQLAKLWSHPNVGDIRQVGLVAGIELVKNWRKRQPFALGERAGIRVCEAMARRGVLTRPIGNVIVIMPPFCATAEQLARIVRALDESIREIFGN